MTKTITAIAYTQALQGNQTIRIYDDATERTFPAEHEDLAKQYAAYLSAKNQGVPGFGVDVYSKQLFTPADLDIAELVRQDALAKLSPEEREVLGLNEGI